MPRGGTKRKLMKLYIDDRDLKRLIEEKRDYIGKKSGVLEVVDAVALFISVITGDYSNGLIPPIIIRAGLGVIVAINVVAIGWKAVKHPKYDKEQMIKDIEALDMKDRRSSIVAIRKADNRRKYLVYYNPEWGFRMFPNFKTQDYENEKSIAEHLSKELNLKESDIKIQHKGTGNEEKFATAHNEIRAYDYSFYSAELSERLPDEDFEIDGKHYYWMTIQEMMEDNAIKEHNEYIVERVSDLT